MKNIMKKTLIFVLVALIAKPAYPVFGVSAVSSTLSRWGMGALSGVVNGAKNHPWLATGAVVTTAAIAWCSYKLYDSDLNNPYVYHPTKARIEYFQSLLKETRERISKKEYINKNVLIGHIDILDKWDNKSLENDFNEAIDMSDLIVKSDDIYQAICDIEQSMVNGLSEKIEYYLEALKGEVGKENSFVGEYNRTMEGIIDSVDKKNKKEEIAYDGMWKNLQIATKDLENIVKEIIATLEESSQDIERKIEAIEKSHCQESICVQSVTYIKKMLPTILLSVSYVEAIQKDLSTFINALGRKKLTELAINTKVILQANAILTCALQINTCKRGNTHTQKRKRQLKKELGTKLAAFKELLSQHTCAE